MNTPLLTLLTPNEMGKALAGRAKALRLIKSWKRETLSKRAGVSAASLKRFENTGKASLELVLKVALVLGCLDEFKGIFRPPPAKTLAELEKQAAQRTRKRGRL
jgi:transcriptional regulator with XRE-family HTH domain